MKKITLVVSLAALILAAGCSTQTAETQPSPPPVQERLSLSAPPNVIAGDKMSLVVSSSGHEGQRARLYAFQGTFDDVSPTCTRTDAVSTEVVLKDGDQAVTPPSFGPGKVAFVLSMGTMTTPCGGALTRVLIKPRVSLSFAKESGVTMSVTGTVDHPPAPPAKTWPVSLGWVGPFATLPEAQSAECVSKKQQEVQFGASPTPVVVQAPSTGLWKLVATVAASDTNSGYKTPCENTDVVMIK